MAKQYGVFLNNKLVTRFDSRKVAWDYAEILFDDATSNDPESIVTVSPILEDEAQ